MGHMNWFNGTFDAYLGNAERWFLERFTDTSVGQDPDDPYHACAWDNPICTARRGHYKHLDSLGTNSMEVAIGHGQPSNMCPWTINGWGIGQHETGAAMCDAAEWLQYLIDHFLAPNGHAQHDPRFRGFAFDAQVKGRSECRCNGGCGFTVVVVDNWVYRDGISCCEWADLELFQGYDSELPDLRDYASARRHSPFYEFATPDKREEARSKYGERLNGQPVPVHETAPPLTSVADVAAASDPSHSTTDGDAPVIPLFGEASTRADAPY